jgi:UDP-N-acetylmuramate--alanine ligase
MQYKYHFIGIGGISMSALAAILHDRGHIISGSDIVGNDQTRMLENLGIKVFIGHKKSNSKHANFIVINGAIRDDNPELAHNIPVITREDLLAEISNDYPTRIAVAGTHGKSTTTAMISDILVAAGLGPTVHNGAVMQPINSNFIIGRGGIFLTEACEFKRSFLTLNPTIAVITNIDFDHVDCFKDLTDVKLSFDEFARKAETVVRTEDCPPINFPLKVPGAHNLENAKIAAQVARTLGIKNHIIKQALENFQGVDRRFQKINDKIISDYAHHPAELIATIKTAKSIYQKFLVIFQPHTYTRTIALFDDFVKALSTCDAVLYKTYAARELPTIGGRAKDIAVALRCKYIATPTALDNFIKKVSHKYDAIILAGAGDMQGKFRAH